MNKNVDKGDISGERHFRLIYLVGTYPGLTNTFIDREIGILREINGFEVRPVSLRRPKKMTAFSPEQKRFTLGHSIYFQSAGPISLLPYF